VKYKLAFLSLFVFLATFSGFGESFRNPVRIATGTDPEAILVADLNGDKRLDILWNYSGDPNLDASTSAPLSVTINP
jgi:hypothetical protein